MWFNFKSSGKARKNTTWYSKGRYYTFDQFGVMKDDWYTENLSAATNGSVTSSDANAYTTEEGTKGTGWVYADTVDENDTKWFYLVSVTTVDGNGTKTVRNIPFNSIGNDTWRAKVIKGKTYVFNTKGEMQDGLQTFTTALPEDNKGGAASKKLVAGTYYFNEGSGSVNSQMVTGKTTVVDDGETYYFYFDSKTDRPITDVVKDGVVYGHDGDRVDAETGVWSAPKAPNQD